MPLLKGCTVSTAKANYNKMLDEGKPKNQAYAISLRNARQSMSNCDSDRQQALRFGQLFNRKPKVTK